MNPITRLEYQLDGIINNHGVLFDPVTRLEIMLSDIKLGNVTSIQPITRVEYYLAKISGADVVLPDPVTRVEIYLAKIAGVDIEVPAPITRIETLLYEWASPTTVSGDIVTFITNSATLLQSLIVQIEPVQDLHGYDSAWAAGGGANLIPTFTEDASANGITLKVNADGSVSLSGTATGVTTFGAPLSTWQWDGSEACWLSGCPVGGAVSTGYSLRIDCPTTDGYSKYDIGDGQALANYANTKPLSNAPICFTIVIRSGVNCDGLVFRPMLNKGSSAQPFAPYSNICPISGHTECNIIDLPFQPTGGAIAIASQQSGTGDPSPTNIRPITAGLTFTMDDNSTLEVAGGTLDIANKKLTVTQRKIEITGSSISGLSTTAHPTGYLLALSNIVSDMRLLSLETMCDRLKVIRSSDGFTGNQICFGRSNNYIYLCMDGEFVGDSLDSFKAYLNEHPVTAVYNIAEGRYDEINLSSAELSRALTALGGARYTVDWETEAGTVYKGVLNVTTGELTVTHGFVELDDEDFITYGTTSKGMPFVQSGDLAVQFVNNATDCWCNQYNKFGPVYNTGDTVRVVNYKIAVYGTNFTDLETGQAQFAANPLQLVAPLSTPLTYQLTPMQVAALVGTNVMWADTGSIEVTYRK